MSPRGGIAHRRSCFLSKCTQRCVYLRSSSSRRAHIISLLFPRLSTSGRLAASLQNYSTAVRSSQGATTGTSLTSSWTSLARPRLKSFMASRRVAQETTSARYPSASAAPSAPSSPTPRPRPLTSSRRHSHSTPRSDSPSTRRSSIRTFLPT